MLTTDIVFSGLRERPAAFTGESTLSSIAQLLNGYSLAVEIHGTRQTDDPLILPDEFNDWVAYRLHYYESTAGWCRMISDSVTSDAEAIERFFLLLEEFHVRKPNVVAKLHGIDKTYDQTGINCLDGQSVARLKQTLRYPTSIVLITYTDDPGFFIHSDGDVPLPRDGFCPTLEVLYSWVDGTPEMLTVLDPAWADGR